MEKYLLRLFQREVERQCRFALLATEDLHHALGILDRDRVWFSTQVLLVAAGNVSKLLWPSDSRYSNRGTDLRASLGVRNDSVLAPRRFRNHFEHFDERLEEWARSSNTHTFVDSNIMSPGAIVGPPQRDFLRNFDPTTWTLTFRGDTYELMPVIRAMQELWQTASKEQSKPPRE